MEVRLDKYLWAVRIFKTRSDAADAIRNNRVLVNDSYAKPSREVKQGDIIEITFGEKIKIDKKTPIIIEGIHAGRGKGYSKKESQQVAAQESLNMIKKNSTFMEQILAVKAIREGEVDKTPVLFEQEKNIPEREKGKRI